MEGAGLGGVGAVHPGVHHVHGHLGLGPVHPGSKESEQPSCSKEQIDDEKKKKHTHTHFFPRQRFTQRDIDKGDEEDEEEADAQRRGQESAEREAIRKRRQEKRREGRAPLTSLREMAADQS